MNDLNNYVYTNLDRLVALKYDIHDDKGNRAVVNINWTPVVGQAGFKYFDLEYYNEGSIDNVYVRIGVGLFAQSEIESCANLFLEEPLIQAICIPTAEG